MASRRNVMVAGLSALTLAATGGRAADTTDWPAASPASQGIDQAALDGILDPARILNVATALYTLRSVVVVRNGFLIEERYFGRSRISTLHPIASATKSIASMLVGIALEQGKIKNLDQTIGDLLPQAAAKAAASAVSKVTLAQILMQTGGFPDDRQSDTRALEPQVKDIPLEPASPPVWRYSSAAVSLIGPILARAVGGSVEDFAKTVLFLPLGIDDYDYDWQRDAAGNARTNSGLRLRARDVAKLAWMMADVGRWRGRQVVPQQWVAESTRRHIALGWQLASVGDIGYGYLWFTGTMHGRTIVWAWGYGAQFALMVPSLDLVVVTLADAPSAKELGRQNAEMMGVVAQIVELAR